MAAKDSCFLALVSYMCYSITALVLLMIFKNTSEFYVAIAGIAHYKCSYYSREMFHNIDFNKIKGKSDGDQYVIFT
jgi:hypothetical protein